eukprot:3878394-Prymnesium_polylepis.1
MPATNCTPSRCVIQGFRTRLARNFTIQITAPIHGSVPQSSRAHSDLKVVGATSHAASGRTMAAPASR